jgi:hypothetical protein
MFKHSFFKYVFLILAAYIWRTFAKHPHQIGAGALAFASYFAHSGLHRVQTIGSTCCGNWRHARISGLECSFAVAQTMSWHAFAVSSAMALETILGRTSTEGVDVTYMEHELRLLNLYSFTANHSPRSWRQA